MQRPPLTTAHTRRFDLVGETGQAVGLDSRRRRRRSRSALLLPLLAALLLLSLSLSSTPALADSASAASAALLSNRFSSSWALLPVSSDSAGAAPPLGICDHMAAFNPAAQTLLLTHGFDSTDSNINSTYVMDLSREHEVRWMAPIDVPPSSAPEPRLAGAFMLRQAASYSTGGTGSRHDASYFLASGLDDSTSFLDEWSLSLNASRASANAELVQAGAAWIKNTAGSPQPPARVWTVSAWVVGGQDDKLVIFGGTRNDGLDSNDLWLGDFTADPMNPAWTEQFPANPPHIMSGHQAAVAGAEMWVFGGYLCTDGGQTELGGSECFSRDLYALGVDPSNAGRYLQWRSILYADHTNQTYWPSNRAWHTMVSMDDRYLIVFGGNFIDGSASSYFYNDLSLFDTQASQWLPMPVRGTVPHIVWSHRAAFVPSRGRLGEMVVAGGCTTLAFFQEHVYVLKIGQIIRAANVTIEGRAVQAPLVAGEPSWFTIHARDESGAPIAWGTGLQFSVFIGGRDAVSGLLGEIDSVVEELGGGIYNISFSPASGVQFGCNQLRSQVQVVIRLDNVLIPGAPFSLELLPAPVSAASILGPQSPGDSVAVQGHASFLHLYPKDRFGNALLLVAPNSSDALSVAHTINGSDTRSAGGLDLSQFTVLIDGAPEETLSLLPLSTSEGALRFQYRAPSRAAYSLSVSYAGSPISGSPFAIGAVGNMDIPAGLNYAFIALGLLGLVLLLALLVIVVSKRNDSRIRASSPTFLALIVVGCMIGMSSLLLPATPEVAGSWGGGLSDASCQAYAWLLGLGFSACFSPLMAKTWRIAKIFNSKQMRVVKLRDSDLMKPVALALGLEVLFNVLWLLLDPMRAVQLASAGNPHVPLLVCDCESIMAWHGVTFFGKISLVIWAVKLTSAVRNAPGEFNEVHAMSAALSNIALCGVVILPLVYFQALEQSPSALYLLKSLITFWCFLFTPAIIIVPKVFETPVDNVAALQTAMTSGTGDEAYATNPYASTIGGQMVGAPGGAKQRAAAIGGRWATHSKRNSGGGAANLSGGGGGGAQAGRAGGGVSAASTAVSKSSGGGRLGATNGGPGVQLSVMSEQLGGGARNSRSFVAAGSMVQQPGAHRGASTNHSVSALETPGSPLVLHSPSNAGGLAAAGPPPMVGGNGISGRGSRRGTGGDSVGGGAGDVDGAGMLPDQYVIRVGSLPTQATSTPDNERHSSDSSPLQPIQPQLQQSDAGDDVVALHIAP